MSEKQDNDTIPCWLDFDPGVDDAFALVLAGYAKNLNLIGISIVAGNKSLDHTSKNTIDLLYYFGLTNENDEKNALQFPVIKGSHKPLNKDIMFSDGFQGETGLGDQNPSDLPETPKNILKCFENINSQSEESHFSTLIYNKLKEAKKKVTIIAIGPLTNIAHLIINHPDCVDYIEKLVFMGGGVGSGNVTPVAEFNMFCDAEAAHVVFETNIEMYMVPLDCTNQATIKNSVKKSIASIKTDFSEYLISLLEFIEAQHKFFTSDDDAFCPLHDPNAVAFVSNPDLFEYKLMRVDIETKSELCYGQTVCSFAEKPNKRKNVHVCFKVNSEKFWKLIIDSIKLADSKSPLNNK